MANIISKTLKNEYIVKSQANLLVYYNVLQKTFNSLSHIFMRLKTNFDDNGHILFLSMKDIFY